MSILKAFNNHLEEFADEFILLFPNEPRLESGRVILKQIIMNKPETVINLWKDKVNKKYQKDIETGDVEFWLNKDLKGGIKGEIQSKLKTMTEGDKVKTVKYIQNLAKLCNLHFMNKE